MMKTSYMLRFRVPLRLSHLSLWLEFSRFLTGCCITLLTICAAFGQSASLSDSLHINSEGYFAMQGLSVVAYNDFYPEGHQGGITIVQFD